MFRARPRVRFNGCYISTVNYVRSGQLSTNQATWGGDPIHIVTYYRSLPAPAARRLRHQPADDGRARRRGAPADARHAAPAPRPPRRRRPPHAPGPDAGFLFVETEGAAGPTYLYRMDLALHSAGPAARNKLVWRAFYSYNKLTDDWAEFCLDKNKPFFFSRVRSTAWASSRWPCGLWTRYPTSRLGLPDDAFKHHVSITKFTKLL